MLRWLFQALVVAAIVFACGQNAFSAPSDEVAVALKAASSAFAQQNWDGANEALNKAESQAKAGGLAEDKLMAKVLCHQAAVLAAQGQANKSIAVFRRALKIDSGVKLTATLARPEVRDAFKKALLIERSGAPLLAPVAEAPSGDTSPDTVASAPPEPAPPKPAAPAKPAAAAPAPVPAPSPAPEPEAAPAPNPLASKSPTLKPAAPETPTEEFAPTPQPKPRKSAAEETAKKPAPAAALKQEEEPDLPASLPRPLHCPNPDEAPPNRKAVLRCVAQPEVTIARVLLFYRLPGNENYESIPATKTQRGWYIASVPAKAFTAKVMQYYFEARDGNDKVVADNGRFESPNLIIVAKGAPAVLHNALAGVRMEGEGYVENSEAEENPITRFFGTSREDTGRKFWLSLAVGRGFGFHGSARLEWYGDEVGGGTHAASLVHIAPELGMLISPHFAVALQGRSQIIAHSGSKGSKEGAPAAGANAALLRFIWFFPLGESSNLQLSALGGAGEGFRLVVPPNEVLMRTSSDTVRGGPWLAGFGVHTDVALNATWALRLGVEALRGFGNSATVIDFAAGGVAWF